MICTLQTSPIKLTGLSQGLEHTGNDRIGLAIHSAPDVHHQVSQEA